MVNYLKNYYKLQKNGRTESIINISTNRKRKIRTRKAEAECREETDDYPRSYASAFPGR